MHADARRLSEGLAADLRAVVGDRLEALVLYGSHAGDAAAPAGAPIHTLAIVRGLGFADLDGCARLASGWQRRGLATPLIIGSEEFGRSLDAFPVEFGAIIARHEPVVGPDPFGALAVRPEDLRRACEVQLRGHMLHLREGYLETHGDPTAIARLVTDSAPALSALLTTLAGLDGASAATSAALAGYADRVTGGQGGALRDVLSLVEATPAATDAARLYPAYLDAVERLVRYVDRWSPTS